MKADPEFLPYHLPVKKISTTEGPKWAIKPERFIFDILPHAQNPVVARVAREDAFATLKAEVPPVQEHLTRLYTAWLRRCGALDDNFTPSCVEIAPDAALDETTLLSKLRGARFFEPNLYIDEESLVG